MVVVVTISRCAHRRRRLFADVDGEEFLLMQWKGAYERIQGIADDHVRFDQHRYNGLNRRVGGEVGYGVEEKVRRKGYP